ncbi:uncharacterized protein LOC110456626 isoform X2 [Mizuhopecten yessoensis]|uniref:tRNA 2-selenouridine synthase n=1 Tax=Mizuhopecten yessoensis TaxID=6573 RepID=A0A210QAJ7_MIZYE|nr:uncharacterized protein LOC110456626 isoform X2 [Mizuhopecten yessoensis]OWF45752.1 tRNA 2-selenouridine synthase [Mizuhopecten yessoensis]
MNRRLLRNWKQQAFVSVFKRRETTAVLKRRETTSDIRRVHYPFPCSVTDVIDLRSEELFKRNHIHGAINIPLVDNVLGKGEHNIAWNTNKYFAQKEMFAEYINTSLSEYFIRNKSQNFCPLVYCDKGSLISKIATHIAMDAGLDVLYVLNNGYISYRKQVLKDLRTLSLQFTFKVISGLTGTGKTFLLTKMSEKGHQVLDLECLAKHKGSMLGLWYGETQPCNDRWQSLLRNALANFDPSKPVWVESESQRIGKLCIPPILFEQICKGDRFKIILPIEERIKCSLRDYPYWKEDTDTLISIVHKLETYCGQEKVNYWISLIESERWEEFVHQLLVEHYDPTYTRSQNKNKLTNSEIQVYMENQSEEVVKSTINFLTELPGTTELKTQ